LFSPGGYPAGQKRMIREGRLRDWLELLSFEVASGRRYCHTLPLERVRRFGTFPKEEWAQRWLPMLCGGYLLHAQKRVQIVTPIRPAWRQSRLRAVGRLEPSTRVSPVAAARSDAAFVRHSGHSGHSRHLGYPGHSRHPGRVGHLQHPRARGLPVAIRRIFSVAPAEDE
jgi:hypothetical protein